MTALLLAFIAGMAGSGHCLGMCGGLVAALSVATPEATWRQRIFATLSYHIGRIITYTLLGVVIGAASEGALLTRHAFGFNILFIFANLTVVLIGVGTMLGVQKISISNLDGTPWSWLGRFIAGTSGSISPFPYLVAGLFMGLLPCGLVYGVLLTTTGSGSWFYGGAKMLFFGLGTLPALMLYGQIATTLRTTGGALFIRIMGGIVALLGCLGIAEAMVRLGVIQPIVLF